MSKPLPDGPVRRTWLDHLEQYHCPDCGGTLGARTETNDRAWIFCLDCGARDVREIVRRPMLNNPPIIPASIEESYQAFLEETQDGD